MTVPDPKQERLTEFERAICYDTLPRVTSPLTLGLIISYTILLAISFAAMVYGLYNDHSVYKTYGTWAFSIVVFVGLSGFVYRALANAIRERAALAEAERLPNVESGFDELPDPFEHHALIRYYRHQGDKSKVLTGNKGETLYHATCGNGGHTWEIVDPAGEPVVSVEARGPTQSFSFNSGTPRRAVVFRQDDETGEILRHFSFGAGRVEILSRRKPERPLVFRNGGLYDGAELVGRVYAMRNYLYLDVRRTYLDDALLGFFVAMLN